MYRMLDLFSGTKSASVAMRQRGWDVVSVDNDPRLDPDISVNIQDWDYKMFGPGSFDLVWASPPCTEFSSWIQRGATGFTGEPSLSLVDRAREIIKWISPGYYVIENVRGACSWIGPGYMSVGPFYLWTNIPYLAVDRSRYKYNKRKWDNYSRASMLRGMVPYPISKAVCDYVEKQPRLF